MPVSDTKMVKVVLTKRNVDIRYTHKTNNEPVGYLNSVEKRASASRDTHQKTYLNPATNSVRTYRHKEKRIEIVFTFYRTKRELNLLFLNSFEGKENELFVTLIYKEQMQDYKLLGKDFRNFTSFLKTWLLFNSIQKYTKIPTKNLQN